MDGIGAVAERFLIAVLGRGDLDGISDIFSDDHVLHDSFMPDLAPGPDGMREMVERRRSSFPDFAVRIDDAVVGDRTVVARVTVGGTHSGPPFAGFPSSGQPVMAEGVCWMRFDGGRIVETWLVLDCLTAALRSGVVVPSESASIGTDPGWI